MSELREELDNIQYSIKQANEDMLELSRNQQTLIEELYGLCTKILVSENLLNESKWKLNNSLSFIYANFNNFQGLVLLIENINYDWRNNSLNFDKEFNACIVISDYDIEIYVDKEHIFKFIDKYKLDVDYSNIANVINNYKKKAIEYTELAKELEDKLIT